MSIWLCPKCGSDKTKVKDSRAEVIRGTQAVRRRRECKSCRHRVTTYEMFPDAPEPDLRKMQAERDIPGWSKLSIPQRTFIRDVVAALAIANDAA